VYLKKTFIHFTYADLNLSSAPAVKLFYRATS